MSRLAFYTTNDEFHDWVLSVWPKNSVLVSSNIEDIVTWCTESRHSVTFIDLENEVEGLAINAALTEHQSIGRFLLSDGQGLQKLKQLQMGPHAAEGIIKKPVSEEIIKELISDYARVLEISEDPNKHEGVGLEDIPTSILRFRAPGTNTNISKDNLVDEEITSSEVIAAKEYKVDPEVREQVKRHTSDGVDFDNTLNRNIQATFDDLYDLEDRGATEIIDNEIGPGKDFFEKEEDEEIIELNEGKIVDESTLCVSLDFDNETNHALPRQEVLQDDVLLDDQEDLQDDVLLDDQEVLQDDVLLDDQDVLQDDELLDTQEDKPLLESSGEGTLIDFEDDDLNEDIDIEFTKSEHQISPELIQAGEKSPVSLEVVEEEQSVQGGDIDLDLDFDFDLDPGEDVSLNLAPTNGEAETAPEPTPEPSFSAIELEDEEADLVLTEESSPQNNVTENGLDLELLDDDSGIIVESSQSGPVEDDDNGLLNFQVGHYEGVEESSLSIEDDQSFNQSDEINFADMVTDDSPEELVAEEGESTLSEVDAGVSSDHYTQSTLVGSEDIVNVIEVIEKKPYEESIHEITELDFEDINVDDDESTSNLLMDENSSVKDSETPPNVEQKVKTDIKDIDFVASDDHQDPPTDYDDDDLSTVLDDLDFVPQFPSEEDLMIPDATSSKRNQMPASPPNFSEQNGSEVGEYLASQELNQIRQTLAQMDLEREKLLSKITLLDGENSLLIKDISGLKSQLEEKNLTLKMVEEEFKSEKKELLLRLSKLEKGKLLHQDKVKEIDTEIEKIQGQARLDLSVIKRREGELESRLELLRMDSENQVKARDMKILDLKRKIDQLEFNMENAVIREHKAKEDKMKLELKLNKLLRSLKGSLQFISDEVEIDPELEDELRKL